MGRGKIYSLHEIADTKAATHDASFDELIERLKAAGADITLDEEVPLYDDIGEQEMELGVERVVEFNLNRTDFRLVRKVENYRIDGAGRHKSLLKLDTPRLSMSLKKKPQSSDDWQTVDVDDLF